jgi:hypothetical protein
MTPAASRHWHLPDGWSTADCAGARKRINNLEKTESDARSLALAIESETRRIPSGMTDHLQRNRQTEPDRDSMIHDPYSSNAVLAAPIVVATVWSETTFPPHASWIICF